jgi:hypothetical protein
MFKMSLQLFFDFLFYFLNKKTSDVVVVDIVHFKHFYLKIISREYFLIILNRALLEAFFLQFLSVTQ